jgi:hypothetical protein
VIDPFNLKPPIQGIWQRQEWVLFSIAVAGRKAAMIAPKVDEFLQTFRGGGNTPFVIVQNVAIAGALVSGLATVKMGQYNRIAGAWAAVSRLGVAKLTVARLEAIPGIGPKTARMIMMYLTPALRVAPLDTHILKFLRYRGHTAPKSTPPAGRVYARLENAFLDIADRLGLAPYELDTAIWQHLASGKGLDTLYFGRAG